MDKNLKRVFQILQPDISETTQNELTNYIHKARETQKRIDFKIKKATEQAKSYYGIEFDDDGTQV
jgi:hypothetical protein